MDLILFRHGDALSIGEQGIRTDEDRPLSEKGIQQTRQSAKGLMVLGLKPDLILTSPLVRAVQSADLIAQIAKTKEPVEICSALACGGSPKDLLSRLNEVLEYSCVLCVGHLPDLGLLVSQFILGVPRVEIPLKKSGICHLEIQNSLDNARLINFLSQRVLSKLVK